jgi:hypothetical protein
MPTDFRIAIAQQLLQLRYNQVGRGVLLAQVIDGRDTLLTTTFGCRVQ